jgi:hypothetical protein
MNIDLYNLPNADVDWCPNSPVYNPDSPYEYKEVENEHDEQDEKKAPYTKEENEYITTIMSKIQLLSDYAEKERLKSFTPIPPLRWESGLPLIIERSHTTQKAAHQDHHKPSRYSRPPPAPIVPPPRIDRQVLLSNTKPMSQQLSKWAQLQQQRGKH